MSELTVPNFLCCKVGECYCNIPMLYTLGRNRLIYVDRCIAPELQSLWIRGIKTGGCCCGHGNKDGFIQVEDEFVDTMKDLGYESIPPVVFEDGRVDGLNCFKPKTVFEFNGYHEHKSVLEEMYEKLVDITKELYEIVDDALEDDKHVCNFGDFDRITNELESIEINFKD